MHTSLNSSTARTGVSSRRQFLGVSAKTLGSVGLLSSLGSLQNAMAATSDTSGYKALVCVYLVGGNNGFNTVVPTSSSLHKTYAASRRNLALAQNTLLPLNGTASDGYAYGLHPAMREMQTLFNTGKAAILGNVGPLVQPATVAQVQAGAVALPTNLFSHSDQQTAWWTSAPNLPERFGWAGRIADLYYNQGYRPRFAMNINIGGFNYWQDGRNATPYVLGINGSPTLLTADTSSYRGGLRRQAFLDILSQAAADPSLMVAEYAGIEKTAMSQAGIISAALTSAGDLRTVFPSEPGDNELGAQLRQVARTIKARTQIGGNRQMFFVQLGGFDTHNDELAQQNRLLSLLSRNIKAFWEALGEIGEQSNVTLFTASDFGRGLGSNGDGSDHAWGNHHLIMGGSVRGGYYGTMPGLALGGPDDLGVGRLVPTTSTDQYAATLARWYGVQDADLNTLLPNLRNFGARNLGFLG